MNDFFANVAARARPDGDAVRPRLASRFETESDPVLSQALYETPVERGGERAGPAETPLVPHRAAATTAHESSTASTPAAARSIASPAPEPAPAGTVSAAAAVAAPVPARTSQQPNAVRARSSPPARAVVRDERRAEPQLEAPTGEVVEPRVRRGGSARTSLPDEPPAHDARGDGRMAEPERAPIRGAERIVPDIVTGVVPPVAAFAPRARPAQRRSSPLPRDAETTIHVSIGRIEVRATQQPGERRREAAAPAVMTLGEYLRSRAERAR